MMKAVIFDMDGVLINSDPLHFAAVVRVLAKHNVRISNDYLNKYSGHTNEFIWQKLVEAFDLENVPGLYIQQQLDYTIEEMKTGNYVTIAGVEKLLESLTNANMPLGLASSSPPIVIKTFLEELKIEKYFTQWISGNEVKKSKPEPFIYTEIVKRLGFQPSECVAIEDTTIGITSAKNAGLKCIGYQNPNSKIQDLSKADTIICSFDEVNIAEINAMFC